MKNLPLHLLLMVLFFSCGDSDDSPEPIIESSDKEIIFFEISNIKGIINADAKTVHLNLSNSVDITSLSPTVLVSQKATVSPASGVVQDFTNPVIYTVTAEDGSTATYTVSVFAECVSAEQIHAFVYEGKNYELIKLNRNWELAAACAVERGGYLAEINSSAENAALYNEIIQNANIDPDNTVANDGGQASYIWLGGNDATTEGSWYWDGDNDGVGIHFWEGDASGSAIDNLFTNWGIEPDDFDGQDGLGLGITQWPIVSGALGNPRQWNDIALSNELYYIIEFD